MVCEASPRRQEAACGGVVDTSPPRTLRSVTGMWRWLRRIAVCVVIVGLVGAGWVFVGLPPRDEVRALARKAPGRTALMVQREGEARRAGHEARTVQKWVPLDRVSSHLLHAVLASEDQRFFGHEGIDWDAVLESVEDNVERGQLWRGGSTLTQQLAKNLYFTPDRSLVRKVAEAVVAKRLEFFLTKDRILELYLNLAEWGPGVFGAEAAAHTYFDRGADDLTLEEAATLAAILPHPLTSNPHFHPARMVWRREMLLLRLRGPPLPPPPHIEVPLLPDTADSGVDTTPRR